MSCGGGDDALDAAGGEISAAAIPLLIASPGFTAFKAGLVPQSAGAITPPGLGVAIPFVCNAGLAADPYIACTSTEGSDTDGSDGDGIPLNYVVRFNCDGVSDGAALRTFVGSYTATDKDDTLYGLTGVHADAATHYSAALLVVVFLAVLGVAWYARVFALKAQDRAIRAEENFRHFILTGKPLDKQLRMGQIIGLRFASDEELPALAKRAVEEKLSSERYQAGYPGLAG